MPWLVLGAVVALVLGPIAMVLIEGFDVGGREGFRFGLTHWDEAFGSPGLGKALWNTATLVTLRVLLGFMVAVPIAWLLARTDMPGRSALEFAFWIAFFMPSLAYIQGWAFLLDGHRGVLNQLISAIPWLGPEVSRHLDVFSYGGIVWVHLVSHDVSALVVLLMMAFRNIDSSLEEAARVAGASKWTTLRTIVMPLSRPAVAMLLIMVFIRAMQSYEVEAVLGRPAGVEVYSTLLVQMLASEPPNIPAGTVLSTVILMCLVPMILLQRVLVGRQRYATVGSKMRMTKVALGRPLRWAAFAITGTMALLQTVVPFAAVLAGSLMVRWGYFSMESPWTLDRWRSVLTNEQFLSSLGNTMLIGVSAGLASAVVCLLVGYVLARETTFKGHASLDFVSWLPWSVPGVLLSLGLLTLVLTVQPLRFLYGTMGILVLAVVLFRFPLSVHLLKSGVMQVNRELEEAAVVCGAGRLSTQWHVTVPILSPMLIGVALMTFVTAVNEISGVVLLASTDVRTLSLMSLDYLMGSMPQRESAAVVTVIMLTMCVGVALVARAFGINLGAGRATDAAARPAKEA